MHEVSLIQNVLELAEEQACFLRATRIHGITLRVGHLAGVEPQALMFAFDVVTAGTIAEGAALQIESVPVVCYCGGCGKEFAPQDFIFACPGCGVLSRDVRAGHELELTSVEVSSNGD